MIENTNTYGGEDTYEDFFLAKITAASIGTGALAGKFVYDWEEQSFDPATGFPVIMAGGRTGTYSTNGQSPALEINNNQISAFPFYVLLKFRCVGDAEAVFEFDGSFNVTNVSNRLYRVNISGTPTAGTFTLQITNPDTTTTNTGNIAYSSTFATVLSNITVALNAVLGTAYAECGGSTWGTITVRMGDSLHTLTGGSVGSLTGASGIAVSHVADGSSGWQVPLSSCDNRTGIKVLNNGTVALFPASWTQTGAVSLANQTMGDNTKYFPAVESIVAGRTVGAGTAANGGLDDAFQGTIFCYGQFSPGGYGIFSGISDNSEMHLISGEVNVGTGNHAIGIISVRAFNGAGTHNGIEFRCLDNAETDTASASIQRVLDATYVGSVVEVGTEGSKNSRFRVVRSDTGDADWLVGAGTYEGIDRPTAVTVGPDFVGGIYTGYNAAGAIADLVPGTTSLTDTQTAINSILAALRDAGIITP